MIDRETIERCAKAIVESMNLKDGDSVVVRGGTHIQQLLEDIGYECYRHGAIPLIISTSDDYSSRVMRDIPAETLERTPQHLLGAYERMDCVITVEPYKDPSIQTKFPREKLEARVRSGTPLRKILHGEEGPGKKWCYSGWPTREAARFFKTDYELFERFIIGGITYPYQELRKRCKLIAEKLVGARSIHVEDPQGTDFWVAIEGRRVNLDDGFVDDEDVEAGDLGNNLPAGEVFVAPLEDRGEGTIFCPLTIDRLSGELIRGVSLTFRDGRLDLDSVEAEEGADLVVSSFRQTQKIDQETQEEVRTLNVAELGIGCNPKITKAIGYVLTDEKIGGSVHLAFGANNSFGGTSKSAMHWDFVTVPEASVTVELADGREVTIMDRGRLVQD